IRALWAFNRSTSQVPSSLQTSRFGRESMTMPLHPSCAERRRRSSVGLISCSPMYIAVLASSLEQFASRRDRKEAFDLAVSNADIPIMHVAGWIAVTGNQFQLLIDLQDTTRIGDHPVLIGTFDVFQIFPSKHFRQACIDALRLQSRVTDRRVRFRVRHDRRQNEQAVFKFM